MGPSLLVAVEKQKVEKEKKPRKPREKTLSGSPNKKGAKGKKKKNPWSDSEDEANGFSDESEVSAADISMDDVVPRSRGPRRAAGNESRSWHLLAQGCIKLHLIHGCCVCFSGEENQVH